MSNHDHETNLVEVVNISSQVMKFELDGMKYVLGPKEKAKVHRSYGTKKRLQPDRDPVPSTVAMLTGDKVLPVTDRRACQALGEKFAPEEEQIINASEKQS